MERGLRDSRNSLSWREKSNLRFTLLSAGPDVHEILQPDARQHPPDYFPWLSLSWPTLRTQYRSRVRACCGRLALSLLYLLVKYLSGWRKTFLRVRSLARFVKCWKPAHPNSRWKRFE